MLHIETKFYLHFIRKKLHLYIIYICIYQRTIFTKKEYLFEDLSTDFRRIIRTYELRLYYDYIRIETTRYFHRITRAPLFAKRYYFMRYVALKCSKKFKSKKKIRKSEARPYATVNPICLNSTNDLESYSRSLK